MRRFRTTFALLVTAVLAVLPVLRVACDATCAAPPPAQSSHCAQHASGSAPPPPAQEGDGCGHAHHTKNVTAARVAAYEPGVVSTPAAPMTFVTGDRLSAFRTRVGARPPSVRTSAASAPLRI